MKIFIHGLLTGFILQLAIGPLFIYVSNIALQNSMATALFTVFAVTLADYLFILLAILGVGKILEKEKFKKIFGIFSSLTLFFFGIYLFFSTLLNSSHSTIPLSLTDNSFSIALSAFLLTLSSPLTILFWTGLFATKSLEYHFNKKNLILFGFAAGLPTFIFLGSVVSFLSLFKTSFSLEVIIILNIFVSFILSFYGIFRFIKIIKT